jgi:hypothetical protein
MIDTSKAVGETESTIIDFEAAVKRVTAGRLAAALLHLASGENIRVVEALASTIANSLRLDSDIDRPFAFDRVRLLRYPNTLAADETPRTAAFQRIARRALSGTLSDPTRGATAFHRIEATPEWSNDLLPIAVFGSFLFYRL